MISCLIPLQKAKEADLHRLADALLEYETLTASEIRQVRSQHCTTPVPARPITTPASTFAVVSSAS